MPISCIEANFILHGRAFHLESLNVEVLDKTENTYIPTCNSGFQHLHVLLVHVEVFCMLSKIALVNTIISVELLVIKLTYTQSILSGTQYPVFSGKKYCI